MDKINTKHEDKTEDIYRKRSDKNKQGKDRKMKKTGKKRKEKEKEGVRRFVTKSNRLMTSLSPQNVQYCSKISSSSFHLTKLDFAFKSMPTG